MRLDSMEEPMIVEDDVVIKDESSPVRRLVMPALKALDDLSDFELSAALRGTARQLSKGTARDPQTYLKERQLIQLVQKQPVLYNCRHREFHDEEHKQRIWQRIAHQLSLEVCKCKNTWAELRYRYQKHVRRLRVYRRETQRRVRKLVRPTMLHGEDLLFLYPHVARQPLLRQKQPVAVADAEPPEDPEVIIVSSEPAVIDLDEDYTAHFQVSTFQHRLIEAVHAYPHLYDSSHPDYTNYPHRGYIWAAISNELHEQATKLMKIWLYLQTRYEWELMQNISQSPLLTALAFMEEHVRKNEHTVYKISMYMQDGWYAPIENFRCIMQFIAIVKSMPELSQMVEDVLEKKPKPARYDALWQQVADQLNSSYQNCEVTWLVLRNYYMELAEMRRAGYKLKDKWFFEKTLADFYRRGTARKKRRAQKRITSTATTTTTPPIEAISDDDEPPVKRPPPAIAYTTGSTTSVISSSSSSSTIITASGRSTSTITASGKSTSTTTISGRSTITVSERSTTTTSGRSLITTTTSGRSTGTITISGMSSSTITTNDTGTNTTSGTSIGTSTSSSTSSSKSKRRSNINNTTGTVASTDMITSSGISCTISSSTTNSSSLAPVSDSNTVAPISANSSANKTPSSGISCTGSSTANKTYSLKSRKNSTSITTSSRISCTISATSSSSSTSNTSSSTSSIKAKNKNKKASNVPITSTTSTTTTSGSSSSGNKARNSNIMASSTVASISASSPVASSSASNPCSKANITTSSAISCTTSISISSPNSISYIKARNSLIMSNNNIAAISDIIRTAAITPSSGSSTTSSSTSCTTGSSSSTSCTTGTSSTSSSEARNSNISASSSPSSKAGVASNSIVSASATISRKVANIIANSGIKCITSSAISPSSNIASSSSSSSSTSSVATTTTSSGAFGIPRMIPKVTLVKLLPSAGTANPGSKSSPTAAGNGALPIVKLKPVPVAMVAGTPLVKPLNGLASAKVLPLATASPPKVLAQPKPAPPSLVPLPKPSLPNMVPLPQPASPNMEPKDTALPKPAPPNLMPMHKALKHPFNKIPLPKASTLPFNDRTRSKLTPPKVLPEAQPLLKPLSLNVLAEATTPVTIRAFSNLEQPPHVSPVSMVPWHKVQPFPQSPPLCNEEPQLMAASLNVDPLAEPETQPSNTDPLSVELVPKVEPLPDSPPTSNEEVQPVAPSPNVDPLPEAPEQPPMVDPLPMVTELKVEPLSEAPLHSNQESQPSNEEPPAKSPLTANEEPRSNEEPPPKTPLPNVVPLPKSPPPSSNVEPLAKPLAPSMAKSPPPSNEQPLPRAPSPSIEQPLPTASPLAHVITVEFFEDATTGRQLKIVGGSPPSATVLTMPRVIMFIREVMAIPQLHNKDPSLQPKIDELWPQISRKYNIPDNICRALFSYWAENIGVFPQIAPMTELMRPFRSNLKVWEKSHRLFSKFDEIARKNSWVKPQLAELMKHIQRYEFLYWDLRRPRPDDPPGPLQPPREFTEEEKEEVWRVAAERFPNMHHQDIWSMFKYAFRTYMEDLERGVENPWPQEWWHALQQLKFLINVRYHPMDPYYYIVHNKFVAEVRRCNMYERLMQPELNAKELPRREQMTPWELEETEKEIKLKQEKTEQEQKEQKKKEHELKVKEEKEQQQKMKDEEEQEQEQNKANKLLTEQSNREQDQAMEQNHTGNQQQATEQAKQHKIVPVTHQEPDATTPPESDSTESVQNDSTLLEVYLTEANEDSSSYLDGMPVLEPVPDTDKITPIVLPSLEPYQLTRLLRCHPATYGKADTATKRKAWVQVAKELNTTVTQCRLSMQHGLREERLLKLTDPKATCKLSAKYYHHMTEIYQHVQAGGELKPQTTAQIRQQLQLETISSPVKPENFIPDINFSTCSPNLVLKNWAFGACKMRIEQQRLLRPRLKEIFARYEKLAENNCPNGSLTKK